MRRQMRKVFALVLCAALALCMAGPAGAQASPHPVGERPGTEHCVYAKANETTFVPAGYTYIYQGEGGKQFTRVASYDMYVTGRILSAAEAKELAALSDSDAGYLTTEDGSAVTCQEFDAKEAAVYSQAVQEILSGVQVEDGQKLSLLAEPYAPSTMVRVMITFEADAVSQMDTMQVHLGQELGAAERNAMQAVKKQQQGIRHSGFRELHTSDQRRFCHREVRRSGGYQPNGWCETGIPDAQLCHSRDSCNNGKRWDFSQFEVHRPPHGGNWSLEPGVRGTGYERSHHRHRPVLRELFLYH